MIKGDLEIFSYNMYLISHEDILNILQKKIFVSDFLKLDK